MNDMREELIAALEKQLQLLAEIRRLGAALETVKRERDLYKKLLENILEQKKHE